MLSASSSSSRQASAEPIATPRVVKKANKGPLKKQWRPDGPYKTYPPPGPAEPAEGVNYVLQSGTCLGAALRDRFPQCHPCVSRTVGHICLFRGVRSYPVQVDDPTNKPIGAPVFVSSLEPDEAAQFPTVFNEPFTLDHAAQLKTVAAHALLQTLRKELEHASQPPTARIKLGLAERSECDTCLHAMFGGKFQCHLCGREQCFDCNARLRQHEDEAEAAGMSVAKYSVNNKCDTQVNRLTKCSGRSGHNPIHDSKTFVPMTRFRLDNLRRWVAQMEVWAETHPVPPPPSLQDRDEARYRQAGGSIDGNLSFLRVPLTDVDPPATFEGPASYTVDPNPPAPGSLTPLRTVPPTEYEVAAASERFHSLWAKGQTMVVDVAASRPEYADWTPQRFAAMVPDVQCAIVSNRTGVVLSSTVGEFFGTFGQGDTAGDSNKIKVSLRRPRPPRAAGQKLTLLPLAGLAEHVRLPARVPRPLQRCEGTHPQ